MASTASPQLGNIQLNSGGVLTPVSVQAGRALYILGRNGTGKSALVHNIVTQLPRTIYIPGSRPSYFDNDSLQITPAARRQMEGNWFAWDRQPQTRYRPINGTQRNEKAILDLQSSETQFKVDAANEIQALGAQAPAIARLQLAASPFDRVNQILAQANLPTRIIMAGAEMQSQRLGSPYSIAKMSDGERAALIMAAEVVSASPHTIFVIDEPELHLHRSIVVPLIAALLNERNDCAFIISTHELDLPSQGTDGTVVLVRGCTWAGDQVVSWDFDVIPSIEGIPDSLRIDLLGSRRKILFVEGNDTSLDQPFYALLFPLASVRPRQTASEVRQAVKALRALEGLHHARAFGLVDNDQLDQDFVNTLKAEGVFPLPIATIESLYYGPEALTAVANHQASTFNMSPLDMLQAARSAAIQAITPSARQEHLAGHVAEQKFRNALITELPDRAQLTSSSQLNFAVPSPYPGELNRLQRLVAANDADAIIARYPVRESPMLSAIAGALRFRDRADYEKAVLTRLGSDSDFRDAVKVRLGDLTGELG